MAATNRAKCRATTTIRSTTAARVAHWEGDTLVVATTGFNEDFWFTNGGLPHTDQLSLVERFSRPDYDTLRYEVTVNDPGAYTQPWSSGWELRWVGGEDLPVYFCQDNRS